ncbi:MAG: hypothetical protein K2Y15_05005 [Burkholderiaceae bacterium]|nr:hypothetical protein [Burkholderiaceae bacterium]
MAMKDLKITKKEAKAKSESMVIGSPEQERYPYGLRLDLNNDTLEKLGMKSLPAVGTVLMFEAKAKVVGSRQSATEGSENRSVELQITHLDLEEGETDEEVNEGELTRGQAGAMSKVAQKMRGM